MFLYYILARWFTFVTFIMSFIATAVVHTSIDNCDQYLKLPVGFIINFIEMIDI